MDWSKLNFGTIAKCYVRGVVVVTSWHVGKVIGKKLAEIYFPIWKKRNI